MKKIDVEQGTVEWFEARYGKVGGSTSKGLFIKSDTLFVSLLAEHLEDFEYEEGFTSDAMQRGNDYEELAFEALTAYTGVKFVTAGWLQCEEIDLLGISPDAITEDETITAEIKCPGKKKHTEVLLNNVLPLDYAHQCVHYFTVNPKLETHYFCSYRPENKLKPLFVVKMNRSTVVNLGTKSKPQLKAIAEWVEVSKIAALSLQSRIEAQIKQLEF